MPVDGWSPSTLGGVVGRKGSTSVHSAWSRDVYLSADTSSPYAWKKFFIAARRFQVGRKAFRSIR